MEKHFTDDQRNLLSSMEDLEKHPWWKHILGIIEARIKELDLFLLWEIDMRNLQTWYIENLDEVKYSMNKVLRNERKILSDLAKKPQEIIKTTWIIS